MSAESQILEWFQDTLFNKIEGVGPHVFTYNIEKLTTDIMPCITVEIDSNEMAESSTLKNNHKKIILSVHIYILTDLAAWNIKELCDIRENLSQAIEAATVPASVIDFMEESTTEFETKTETVYKILKQTINYSFLVKETDY